MSIAQGSYAVLANICRGRQQNQPTQPLAASDSSVVALTEFFNRFNGGRVTPPELDSEILLTFLRLVPEGTPALGLDFMAFDLVRTLDCVRKQSADAWVH